MSDSLEAVVAAFDDSQQRPAVFDRALRRNRGQWWLESPVDVRPVIEAFVRIGAVDPDTGYLRIPIHEADSAEITGEYLYCNVQRDPVRVAFFDFSTRSPVELSIDEFASTYPAWRVRFWLAGRNPATAPSYLRHGATIGGATASGSASPTASQTPAQPSRSPSQASAASPSQSSPQASVASSSQAAEATNEPAAPQQSADGTVTAAEDGTTASSEPSDDTESTDIDDPDTNTAAQQSLDDVAVEPDSADVTSDEIITETTVESAATAESATPAEPMISAETAATAGEPADATGTTDAVDAADAADAQPTIDAQPTNDAQSTVDAQPTVDDQLDSYGTLGVDPDVSARDADDAATGNATVEGDAFFERLRSFVEREREAAREETREAYRSMGKSGFLTQYDGVAGVEPRGREINDYGQQIIVLEITPETDSEHATDGDESTATGTDAKTKPATASKDKLNRSDESATPIDVVDEYSLYPGSEVFIDRLDSGSGFPVEAELFAVDGTELRLGVYWDSSDDKGAAEAAFDADSDATFLVAQLVNGVPFDREFEAISTIQEDPDKRRLLTGNATLTSEERSYAHVGTELNPSQQTAARRALRSEDVCLVHGPPGTGKTRTLTAIMREYVDQGKRVLACAHSNQAVDNLVVGSSTTDRPDPRSIHADAVEGAMRISRIGSNTASEIVEQEYADADHWHADIVAGTMSAVSDLADDMFDVVVIDEATQATIPSTCIPLAKAETAVLAGDHKQLPPYCSTEHHEVDQPERSLFEHLLDRYGSDVKTTLSTQYRMHETIAAFPNDAFYDGVLTHGERNRTWTVGPLAPLVAYDVDGVEDRTPAKSTYNRMEAAVVAHEVERALDGGAMAGEIGVITPYSGQIGIIRSELNTQVGESRTAAVAIDTIDSFQGSERDVIILSFVRSNADGNIGFLDAAVEGPRRLNVALTRAKKRLVVIGNWNTLTRAGPHDEGTAKTYYRSLRDFLEEQDAFQPVPVE